MKNYITAILLSLFVYPGSGHMYLGQKVRGTVYSLLFTCSLLYLAIVLQQSLVRELEALADPLKMLNETSSVITKSFLSVKTQFLIGGFINAALWLIAAIDIYLNRPKKEGQEAV